jgi:hypothetical protein
MMKTYALDNLHGDLLMQPYNVRDDGVTEQLSDIKFHPHSFFDSECRLFSIDGEIYRGISGKSADFFQNLFKKGIIERLNEKGLLIESERVWIDVKGYDLVVKHRCIPFASYPNEWCASMLKDGMLTMLNLLIELSQYDLTLVDAHPWNLLFDIVNHRPVFIDLGSIVPLQGSTWGAYEEFCRFCLYPLILMANHQDAIGRLLMIEDQGVSKSDVAKLTKIRMSPNRRYNAVSIERLREICPQFLKQYLRSYRDRRLALVGREDTDKQHYGSFLKRVRESVESIQLNSVQQDCSSFEKIFLFPSKEASPHSRQEILDKVLAELCPKSILDLNPHEDWYAACFALNSQVVSFDMDSGRTSRIYQQMRRKRLPMLPLIMDFTKSTPNRGLLNQSSVAANERLSCDLVLGIGVINHLVEVRHLTFEHLAEGFSSFAQRWVLVDFIQDNSMPNSKHSKQFSWCKLENLIAAMKKRFQDVQIIPYGSELDVLLLCKK